MAVLATRIWPSWRRTTLQPKGSRLGSPHARPKLGTDFRRRGFAGNGNRGPISGETAVLKTLGRHRAARTMCVSARDVNITSHRPCVQMQGPGGAAKNVRSTSRGAGHVCKREGSQHHVASTMCANARDVNIA